MLSVAIAGGFFNAVRGGQWRVWLNSIEDDDLSADPINAAAFGITTGLVTGNWFLALIAAAFMWLGAAGGWGDYIGALGGWRVNDLKENKFIDPLIKRFLQWPKWWGAAGLTLRGLFWGICLALPFWLFGFGGIALAFIQNSLLMAPAYWLAIAWMGTRVHLPEQGWGLGEIFYGVILWSALASGLQISH